MSDRIPGVVPYGDHFEVLRDAQLIAGMPPSPVSAGAVVLLTRSWGPENRLRAVAYISGSLSNVMSDQEMIDSVRRELVAKIEDFPG